MPLIATHNCCSARNRPYSPDEPNVRPVTQSEQRKGLLTKPRLDTTRDTVTGNTPTFPESRLSDTPDSTTLIQGQTSISESPSKLKLTSRLKERLSFGGRPPSSQVLIKTQRKQPSRLQEAVKFRPGHSSQGIDLALSDERTPSRGGYDADAQLISEHQLFDGTLNTSSELASASTSTDKEPEK